MNDKVRASELALRPNHGLAVTKIDGQTMVANELVEALHEQYTKAMRRLTRAIEREGFDVMVDVDGNFTLRQR